MNDWISVKEKPITKSGFYMIITESGNIHKVKHVWPGSFMSGFKQDYRNGLHYPVTDPIKYIYLYGLNKNWEPDESILEKDVAEGI